MPHRRRRTPTPGRRACRAALELLRLPAGAPLGVGGVDFDTITVLLHPGGRLLLCTDGLVETRDDPIDERLNLLLSALGTQRKASCPGHSASWRFQIRVVLTGVRA
ncbi:SpoIIE family protein phosphatase [Streptomyces tanashiensis]